MIKKLGYIFLLLLGFFIFVYFYIFNFNSMSETELVEKVLYWFVPIICGVYGLTAMRIHEKVTPETKNALQHIFSGKDKVILAITIGLLTIGGCFGGVFFLIPVAIFNPQSKNFDLYTTLVGLFLWTAALAFFLFAIFPSL